MTDIGVEVGQKMRSAIKAKLMELECYVDDELPDYIMVMVANKRTKSQMSEDLQLFLASQTSTFVDWLHIVLKKLKEVHVTNPRKKEAKIKKPKKKEQTPEPVKSLTDNLPLNISKLSEPRKIVLIQENTNVASSTQNDLGFDIPSLAEVNSSSEKELRLIEKQLKNVKSRLGMVVQSDSEEEFLNIKAEPDELFPNEQSLQKKDKTENKIDSNRRQKKSVLERLGKRQAENDDDIDFRTGEKKLKLAAIENKKDEHRINMMRRKMFADKQNIARSKANEKKKYDWNKNEKEKADEVELEKRENILHRLGVMSKVAVVPPKKPVESDEEDIPPKEVPSMVKVKPRVIPTNTPQANKNLLLKAVAEAQRSIAQTPAVGTNKPDALFTKKYQQKIQERNSKPKLPDKEKNKLKTIMKSIERELNYSNDEDNSLEYIPKPTKRIDYKTPDYIPSPKEFLSTLDNSSEDKTINHSFIVTLDGIDKTKFESKLSPKTIEKRRTPSPIIFDKVTTTIKKVVNVPDRLPIVRTSPSVKNKERCKYWPSCRHGEKCEFVHPSTPCKAFPQCKFGDKCLYIHPSCKFESSCTRRDCPYDHTSSPKAVGMLTIKYITCNQYSVFARHVIWTDESYIASRIVPSTGVISIAKQALQTCKYFPSCNNLHCTFYHPKPCKFGKFCKNQAECNFSHKFVPKNTNLTWRNEFKV
ncbi:zinc finger ccch domain-containing protein 14 [Holotrichia oblita]|uniref:Zinc finger ccch domain-containing protein 14 n=1 Tax=Holotrichia oblita TaxID=644536 RepID=A0ACB9T9V4_HOLOL|nr:zinc finger ccch domain-containing protein 14 [Holotrichia oblita]